MVFTLLNELQAEGRNDMLALVLNRGILSDRLQNIGVETTIVPEETATFVSLLLQARRRLYARNIGIIHSHGYKENILAALLAPMLGVSRLYCTIHGLPEAVANGGRGTALKTRAKRWLELMALRARFSGVVAVSDNIKNELIREYAFKEEQVTVIHNGVPIPNQKPTATYECLSMVHIGTVGRMVPVKQFDLFLRVAAEVKSRVPNVKFSILGDGPLREYLADEILRLRLGDCVELVPPMSDPLAYFQSLDIYMNTSLHEGIPLSVLEAMSCGKPVIAPRVGGIPEIVCHGEEGYLINSTDPVEFAGRCLALIEDPIRRSAMGRQGARTVQEKFSSRQMASGYKRVYEGHC